MNEGKVNPLLTREGDNIYKENHLYSLYILCEVMSQLNYLTHYENNYLQIRNPPKLKAPRG